MGIIESLFSSSAEKLTKTAGAVLDDLITSKEEKGEIEIKLSEIKRAVDLDKMNFEIEMKRFQMEAENREYEDRRSAREMQIKTQSRIPGALTILFTVGFFGLGSFLTAFLLGRVNLELSQFTTVFISTMFGAVNAIMVQIISFYFGSSKGGEDNVGKMADSFNRAAENR